MTIEKLKDEILELDKKNVPHMEHLAELLKQRNDDLGVIKSQELEEDIRSVRKTISNNNDRILEKEKQITAAMQRGENHI